jgi:hypothetical protein
MDRLSQGQNAPQDGNPATFTRCWICGKDGNDICGFRMWQECDEKDEPEESTFIIACRSKACDRIIDAHPRLYIEVPWAGNAPGQFMLACSDCEKRQGFKCTDPRAKTNGGDGLSCRIVHPLTGIICTEHGCHPFLPVIYECEGHTKKAAP